MTAFPFFHFTGSHADVGREHGRALRDAIHLHLERLERRFARQGVPLGRAESAALVYEPAIEAASPGLVAEIHGLAEGADVSAGAAFLLQLRAEVFVDLVGRHGAEQECTTFAISPERTGTTRGFVGQNADLPAMYHDLMTVQQLSVEGEPQVMMATPAGQISYIGINDAGLGVFGNYLHSDRWRLGFPRYLYTRVALRQSTVPDAERELRGLHRASSRNIIMLDAAGRAVDLENTAEEMISLHAERGVLVHANHYADARLAGDETNPFLENSQTRHRRLSARIDAAEGPIGPHEIAAMLRDRSDHGDELSIHPEDDQRTLDAEDRNMTVTSVIAEPARGQVWIASGPPSLHTYRRHGFSPATASDEEEL